MSNFTAKKVRAEPGSTRTNTPNRESVKRGGVLLSTKSNPTDAVKIKTGKACKNRKSGVIGAVLEKRSGQRG